MRSIVGATQGEQTGSRWLWRAFGKIGKRKGSAYRVARSLPQKLTPRWQKFTIGYLLYLVLMISRFGSERLAKVLQN